MPRPAGSTRSDRPARRPEYVVRGVGVELQSSEGPRKVLQGITFEVDPGEIVGIVGRSGTGKTTLLRIMAGLLSPTAGLVELAGVRVVGPPGTAVTVFQDYQNALLPWRSVSKNVALPLERKVNRREREKRVGEALKLVGLEGRGRDFPWRLSGGMQQRVQIARALAVGPRVLLMDEPFGALDAITKSTLQDEVLRVHEHTGATIVFITHDLDEAIYMADRVLVLSGSPGAITTECITDLPRPRHQIETRELPAYLRARHRLAEALKIEQ